VNNVKNYKFSVRTLYADKNINVKRKEYKNWLYIYVFNKNTEILSLKVIVYE
jgi:hypothetical protein